MYTVYQAHRLGARAGVENMLTVAIQPAILGTWCSGYYPGSFFTIWSISEGFMVTMWLGLGLIALGLGFGWWRWYEYRYGIAGPDRPFEAVYAVTITVSFLVMGGVLLADPSLNLGGLLTVVSVQNFGYFVVSNCAVAICIWTLCALGIGLGIELGYASAESRDVWWQVFFAGHATRRVLHLFFWGMIDWLIIVLVLEAWLWYQHPSIN